MVGAAYVSPTGVCQTTRGPSLGQLLGNPVSADLPFRPGPRKSGQSWPRSRRLSGSGSDVNSAACAGDNSWGTKKRLKKQPAKTIRIAWIQMRFFWCPLSLSAYCGRAYEQRGDLSRFCDTYYRANASRDWSESTIPRESCQRKISSDARRDFGARQKLAHSLHVQSSARSSPLQSDRAQAWLNRASAAGTESWRMSSNALRTAPADSHQLNETHLLLHTSSPTTVGYWAWDRALNVKGHIVRRMWWTQTPR